MQISKENPVVNSDFPDPDIIRVGDTYYMASTTMHYMPGCDILRSFDLMNWEFVCHVYDILEKTTRHMLVRHQNVYGKGMWAPSLRWHDGKFYLCFACNDTHKSYLFIADTVEGPWEKNVMGGFFYDSSLFFDDDDRVYIVHGNTELYLTELETARWGPKPGGLDRLVARDEGRIRLGFEGSHLYKHDNHYYLFTCHMLDYGSELKTEVCLMADSLEGKFKGKCILDDDMGYRHLGVAQGGMVDTPDGDWYAFMFQDRGALGRAPVLMPMRFDENGFPVLGDNGSVPHTVSIPSTRPDHVYTPLNGDDDFEYQPQLDGKLRLKLFWQFNHNPVNRLWSLSERPGALRLKSGKVCKNLVQAYNTLTQRCEGPRSAASVTVDGNGLKDGDFAGISAFQGCYGAIALTRNAGKYYLVMLGKPAKNETIFGDFDYDSAAVEYARIPVPFQTAEIRVFTDFATDEATFFYRKDEEWVPLGVTQKLYFKMDHFTGCRFGLFLFSTEMTGGVADFTGFRFQGPEMGL